jgi:hypothetical protein
LHPCKPREDIHKPVKLLSPEEAAIVFDTNIRSKGKIPVIKPGGAALSDIPKKGEFMDVNSEDCTTIFNWLTSEKILKRHYGDLLKVVEMKRLKDHCWRMRVEGPGDKYCMHIKDFHKGNHVCFLFYPNYVVATCMDKECEGKKVKTPQVRYDDPAIKKLLFADLYQTRDFDTLRKGKTKETNINNDYIHVKSVPRSENGAIKDIQIPRLDKTVTESIDVILVDDDNDGDNTTEVTVPQVIGYVKWKPNKEQLKFVASLEQDVDYYRGIYYPQEARQHNLQNIRQQVVKSQQVEPRGVKRKVEEELIDNSENVPPARAKPIFQMSQNKELKLVFEQNVRF